MGGGGGHDPPRVGIGSDWEREMGSLLVTFLFFFFIDILLVSSVRAAAGGAAGGHRRRRRGRSGRHGRRFRFAAAAQARAHSVPHRRGTETFFLLKKNPFFYAYLDSFIASERGGCGVEERIPLVGETFEEKKTVDSHVIGRRPPGSTL